MQKLLNERSSVLSGRIIVTKATTAGIPNIGILRFRSNSEMLVQLILSVSPSTPGIQYYGVIVRNGQNKIYPASGSDDDASITGANNGLGMITQYQPLDLAELNQILDGPPYDLTFEFYNLSTDTDLVFGAVARTTPKVDLLPEPVNTLNKNADPEEEK